MAQVNAYPLRVDKTLMEKFRVVAETNGRSVNKEIEFLMKTAVKSFEQENGPISLPFPPESSE